MVASDELNEEATEETPEKLSLDVKVSSPSACERHVTVTISQEDIHRYFDRAFSEMMPKASVPGFRAGRAPRKLIEHRFRKEVVDQVKGSLLMDSLSQVTEEQKFSAISEPDFDPKAITVPDEGPMTFEFDLEVRPEFDLPEWRGLSIERPVREFTTADVDKELERLLAEFGRLAPLDGPAKSGDYISCNLTFKHGDEVLSEAKEEVIRLKPVLSFRDCKIENFDQLLKGVRGGETREAKAKLTNDAPNESLRGQDVTAIFEVLEVKQLELPELTPEFLSGIGFDGEGELRDAVKSNLQRRMEYQQQQAVRRQVTSILVQSAQWDLPPALLRRQSQRELERAVLELRRSGFSEDDIRAHSNDLRQNNAVNTARALKEHFILERIAEDQKIDAESSDYDVEVSLIAQQSNESPRRVRARLEKGGMMDALRNQIVERKVIELILAEAKFKEVPYQAQPTDTEAVDQAAGGEHEEPAAEEPAAS
jgi:trigger factor